MAGTVLVTVHAWSHSVLTGILWQGIVVHFREKKAKAQRGRINSPRSPATKKPAQEFNSDLSEFKASALSSLVYI